MKRKDFVNKLMKISELNSQYNSLKDMPLFCVRPTSYVQSIQVWQAQNKRHQIYSELQGKPNYRQKTEVSTFSSPHSTQKLNEQKRRRVITERTQILFKKKDIGSISLNVRQNRKSVLCEIKKKETSDETNGNEAVQKQEVQMFKAQDQTNIIQVEGSTFINSNTLDRRLKNQTSLELGKRKLSEEKQRVKTFYNRQRLKAQNPRFYRHKKLLAQNTMVIFASNQKRLQNSARASRENERQKQKVNKISLLRQINKNYRKPFLPPPKVTAKSYIICEIYPSAQQKIITSFNCKIALEIASLTKIMTCIVTLDICEDFKIDKNEEYIAIGKIETSVGGTSAQLLFGQVYSITQLLFGLMLPSGNDASVALAIWAGSLLLCKEGETIKREEFSMEANSFGHKIHKIAQRQEQIKCYNRFIKEMNIKASSLKMAKTTYANSHGLANPQNKSTAYDLALLCHFAMRNPEFRKIVHIRSYNGLARKIKANQNDSNIQKINRPQRAIQGAANSNNENSCSPKSKIAKELPRQRAIEWQNTHKLMQIRPKQYIGIKTGYTKSAGPCLSSCVLNNGREFLIIILNCEKVSFRFKQTETLKKWLYKHLKLKRYRKKAKVNKTEQSENELEGEDGIDQTSLKRIIEELKQERQKQD